MVAVGMGAIPLSVLTQVCIKHSDTFTLLYSLIGYEIHTLATPLSLPPI